MPGPARRARDASPLPQFWSREPDGQGGERLTYAVRGGGLRWALIAAGAALVAAGLAGALWLVQDGGLTVAGWVLLVLVPGGAVLAGVYVLDRMLWARAEYVLGQGMIDARQVSVFGGRRTQIPRGSIQAVAQRYTPPSDDASSADAGSWVTFVRWRTPQGQPNDFAFDGLHTQQERHWLGPLLADWAQVPLARGFSDSAEEADPADLPDD